MNLKRSQIRSMWSSLTRATKTEGTASAKAGKGSRAKTSLSARLANHSEPGDPKTASRTVKKTRASKASVQASEPEAFAVPAASISPEVPQGKASKIKSAAKALLDLAIPKSRKKAAEVSDEALDALLVPTPTTPQKKSVHEEAFEALAAEVTPKARSKKNPLPSTELEALLSETPTKTRKKKISVSEDDLDSLVTEVVAKARKKKTETVSLQDSPSSGSQSLKAKLEGQEKARKLALLVQENKAEEIILYDVRASSSITDFVLLCQGRSQGHVKGISDQVELSMKKLGAMHISIEGYTEGSWILMDYDEVIVHIFHPETRRYYKIEKLHETCPQETFQNLG